MTNVREKMLTQGKKYERLLCRLVEAAKGTSILVFVKSNFIYMVFVYMCFKSFFLPHLMYFSLYLSQDVNSNEAHLESS